MKTLARPRDTAEILARLAALRADSRARWGRMTAHQMVCHLCDSFRFVAGEKEVSAASGPLQRTAVKWIALYLPVPWPPGIPTRPELDQQLGGTAPQDFADDLAALAAMTARVTATPDFFRGRSHPIFGAMSRAAWLRWGYRHMDHHLRQFGA